MSHADYLRGQTDANLHNFILGGRNGSPAVIHLDDKERKELNANANGISKICLALKTELHRVDPGNPMVNPIRTMENPIVRQLYESGRDEYLKTKKQTVNPEFEAIAAAQGYPAEPDPEPEKKGFLNRIFGDSSADGPPKNELEAYAQESARKLEEARKPKLNGGEKQAVIEPMRTQEEINAQIAESQRLVEETLAQRKKEGGGGFFKRLVSGG